MDNLHETCCQRACRNRYRRSEYSFGFIISSKDRDIYPENCSFMYALLTEDWGHYFHRRQNYSYIYTFSLLLSQLRPFPTKKQNSLPQINFPYLEFVFLSHFFCYNEVKLWLASCNWLRKPKYLAKTTTYFQVIVNFLTYPGWDANPDSGERQLAVSGNATQTSGQAPDFPSKMCRENAMLSYHLVSAWLQLLRDDRKDLWESPLKLGRLHLRKQSTHLGGQPPVVHLWTEQSLTTYRV